jgi:hypothetical protein
MMVQISSQGRGLARPADQSMVALSSTVGGISLGITGQEIVVSRGMGLGV